jgi:type IV pilus assembly protein PilA
MLHTVRRRAEDEKGFTLIELLVVILIIGILAAIAIPAFLNQRGKAYDSSAKSQASTLQTAMETYATDNNGDYSTATLTKLQAIEPTLNNTSGPTAAVVSASATGYTVSSTAKSTLDVFYVTLSSGSTTRSCTNGTGGGSPGGCSGATSSAAGTW